jgi:hypothetical protein
MFGLQEGEGIPLIGQIVGPEKSLIDVSEQA